tara:strand:+ start:15343 stop:15561 length:219 start_codon:yes stop_codon:yes gene_type:complete
MKPSATKNRTFYGRPVTFVEIGDQLFFGGNIQKMYTVTHMKDGRTFSDDIDLTTLSKKEQPICFTNNELCAK